MQSENYENDITAIKMNIMYHLYYERYTSLSKKKLRIYEDLDDNHLICCIFVFLSNLQVKLSHHNPIYNWCNCW